VEWLSGKPVELGLAPPRGWFPGRRVPAAVSHQAGPYWRGRGPVVPHVAGTHQGLKDSGLGWGTGIPASWGWAWTGSRDPGGCGSGGMAKGWVFWQDVGWGWQPAWLRDGYPAMCGSGTELWPGAARGVESQAEWSSGSADQLGGDLAGHLFLY
jgi:hypothetical protein